MKTAIVGLAVCICVFAVVQFLVSGTKPIVYSSAMVGSKDHTWLRNAKIGDKIQIPAVQNKLLKKTTCVIVLGGACCMFSQETSDFMISGKRKDILIAYAGDFSDESLVRSTYHIPSSIPLVALNSNEVNDLGREWAPSAFLLNSSGEMIWKQKTHKDIAL